MRKHILTAVIIASSLTGCLEPPNTKQEGEACSAEDKCRQGLSCVDGTCADLDAPSDMGADGSAADSGTPTEDMGAPEDTGGPEVDAGSLDMGRTEDLGGTEDMGMADMAEPACGGTCPDSTPFCDVMSDECAVCVDDVNCQDGVCLPGVSAAGNACVECADTADCDSGVCDTDTNTCVLCVADADCANGVCEMGATSADNQCVECLDSGDCLGGVCDTAANTCVGCLENGDCMDGVCDGSSNTCVACLDNTDCTDAGAAKCDLGATTADNACVSCSEDAHCVGVQNADICDAGKCIDCYVESEASDCPGTFCDPATNACTATVTGAGTGCDVCASDGDCAAGHRCVQLQYQASNAGSFCMPIYDASEGDCPRPFSGARDVRTTADGQSLDICLIDEMRATCGAIDQFNSACPTGNECTATGGTCELIGGLPRCSYACVGDATCVPGFACGGTIGDKYCGGP